MATTLRDHLRTAQISVRSVARAAGTSETYLHQLLSGSRRPSSRMAKRLERASHGALKAAWLLDLEELPPPAQAA